MLEITVLAILALAVAGSVVVGAAEKEAASRIWPLLPTALAGSEPADEGATVSGSAERVPDEELPKAA